MPTGYTADVADGKVKDFRAFALRCARNFGACLMQRDEPLDREPTLLEPSDYHANALATAERELAELQGMTEAEAGRRADAEHIAQMERHERSVATQRDTKRRYEEMLRAVDAWTPPTPDHAGMKRFMREQLEESIKFDCNYHPSKPMHKSGREWLTERRRLVAESIARHREEHRKEVERTTERNRWIRDLYDSLAD